MKRIILKHKSGKIQDIQTFDNEVDIIVEAIKNNKNLITNLIILDPTQIESYEVEEI